MAHSVLIPNFCHELDLRMETESGTVRASAPASVGLSSTSELEFHGIVVSFIGVLVPFRIVSYAVPIGHARLGWRPSAGRAPTPRSLSC